MFDTAPGEEDDESANAVAIQEAQEEFRRVALQDHLRRIQEEERKGEEKVVGTGEAGGKGDEKVRPSEEDEERERGGNGSGREEVVAWVGKSGYGIVKGE